MQTWNMSGVKSAMKKIKKGTDTEGWVAGDFSDFFSIVQTSGGSGGAVVVMREERGLVCLGTEWRSLIP